MLQYIIVILIGIAVVAFVVKRIYKVFFQKSRSAGLCSDCPGCALNKSRKKAINA
ncbi:MAG: FeoB-associated Cys-rich membrane protein [Dysgonamonadaceae bacterium]|jgi:hypothetical protein|nr:FeoB-associated Cys-rich membrane protein [Dysgonamonadaceae bacterium]